MQFTLSELDAAHALVAAQMPPSPQYAWPLLAEAAGAEVWLKHENHTPAGAFKIRGGITYIDWLRKAQPEVRGIITATRGNHGQSQARAASAAGLQPVVVVPHGNSAEKNAAMRGFGARLLEHGADFETARAEAERLAQAEGLSMVPSFHPELVRGVATCGLELLRAVPDLDTVYVPVGLGSGICGMIAARDALGHPARIVGVVAEGAPAARLSFEAGHPVATNTARTFADGIALRSADAAALAIYRAGAERLISVSDAEIAEAMRLIFRATHNLAEGAGAAALAGLMQERGRLAGRKVAAVLSGGNIDTPLFAEVLAGGVPAA
ncbi:threonine dehydratase [Oceanicella sp. SM1341]|uniref:threonine dehydratase n=1 Tax=Oceanicella sp. SM1341 TaxID=1548889 RepID=UPI000E4D4DA1|nr:threonine dehydratase [Oceanicella sp. SM1341]